MSWRLVVRIGASLLALASSSTSALAAEALQNCPCLENGGQPGPGDCPCDVTSCFGVCIRDLCPATPNCMLECSFRCSCNGAPSGCVTHVDPGPTPIGSTPTATLGQSPTPTSTPAGFSGRCLGDCNGDEAVTIDELLRGVRIALGEAPRSVCQAGGTGLFPLGISALTSAVLNALVGCVTERDLSDFTEFEWQEAPALGFCPEIGSPASARLSRVGTDYRLAIRLIALADPPPPGCEPPPAPLVGCYSVQPERCRFLTADEVERVHDAFAHVRVQTGPDAACLDLIIDPCVVTTARWDDACFSNYPHTSDRLDDTETGRLDALLRSITIGPEVACP